MNQYIDKKNFADNDVYAGVRLDKFCEHCGGQLLGNALGDEWCSVIDCDYISFSADPVFDSD